MPTLSLQPYPSTPSKGDEAVMGYHPGHTVTPGVEVDFSVDSSRGGDNANWTGVNFRLYNTSKEFAISSQEQQRE